MFDIQVCYLFWYTLC